MQIVYPIYYLFGESDIACAPHCSAYRFQFNEHKWKKPHDKWCRTWMQSAGANVIVNHLINGGVAWSAERQAGCSHSVLCDGGVHKCRDGLVYFCCSLGFCTATHFGAVSLFDHHLCRIFSRLNAYHKSPRNYFHRQMAHTAPSTRIDNINRAHSILL